jgi:hypothetical protein
MSKKDSDKRSVRKAMSTFFYVLIGIATIIGTYYGIRLYQLQTSPNLENTAVTGPEVSGFLDPGIGRCTWKLHLLNSGGKEDLLTGLSFNINFESESSQSKESNMAFAEITSPFKLSNAITFAQVVLTSINAEAKSETDPSAIYKDVIKLPVSIEGNNSIDVLITTEYSYDFRANLYGIKLADKQIKMSEFKTPVLFNIILFTHSGKLINLKNYVCGGIPE